MIYNRDTKTYMSIFDLIPRDDVAGWAKRFYTCPEPATYPPELYIGRGAGCARCKESFSMQVGHMCADVAEYMTTDAWKEAKAKMDRETTH